MCMGQSGKDSGSPCRILELFFCLPPSSLVFPLQIPALSASHSLSPQLSRPAGHSECPSSLPCTWTSSSGRKLPSLPLLPEVWDLSPAFLAV